MNKSVQNTISNVIGSTSIGMVTQDNFANMVDMVHTYGYTRLGGNNGITADPLTLALLKPLKASVVQLLLGIKPTKKVNAINYYNSI